MDSSEAFPVVKSPFNLQTYQKRLRHLQSIAVRNLHYPRNQDIDFYKVQVFFTLHKDTKAEAFYTSEKVIGSLNPTWQSFDLERCDTGVDLTAKFVLVRVWMGHGNQAKVKIEAHVHLSGLVFFSPKLQVPGVKHQTNTLLYGMFNKIFVYYDKNNPKPQLEQWIPDLEVPSGNLPAVVAVDELSVRPMYNTNALSRIHTVQRAIKQTQASVNRIHTSIEDKLMSSHENLEKLAVREDLLMKVRLLRKELLWQTQQKQTEQEGLESYCDQQEARISDLKLKRNELQTCFKSTEENRTMHIQSREMLVKENAQVLFRRKQIISEMVHHIYPITEDDKHNFCICGVKLPNAEDYHSQDEVRLSVALGFTCHLTLMVSHFMDMPLRYPMVHRGSRSTIIDHIHSKLTEKDREFPLYGKGKEKFQYNYAVFLINKNISQLRFYCGLGTSDLRQTLPNMKSLLEQRLGVRSSLTERKGTTSVQSPPSTSIGGSQASKRSQIASSNASSYARQDIPYDLDTAQNPSKTPNNLNPVVEGIGLSNLDPGYPGIPKRLSHSMSFPEGSSVVVKPLLTKPHSNTFVQGTGGPDSPLYHSKDFNGGFENEAGTFPNDLLNVQSNNASKNLEQKKDVIDEEDETEDIFKPSDDNFFQVGAQPVLQAFNKLFTDSQKDSDAISSSFSKDIATNGDIPSSNILLSNSQRTFKLVKGSALSPLASPNSYDVLETVDEVLTAEGSNGCTTDAGYFSPGVSSQHPDSAIHEVDSNSFCQSSSYDDSDFHVTPEKNGGGQVVEQ